MKNNLLIPTLLLCSGLLFYQCNTCPEPAVHSIQEVKGWICYKEGQMLKFVDSTGKVQEYEVKKVTTT